jgi:RNA polymerase sigma factor (TIGR02999 family)
MSVVNKSVPETPEITLLLREWSEGKAEALDELLPFVYNELHKQASRYLRNERQGHTLQTTALIHEAYLKLINVRSVDWQGRTHFFAIASQVMRRVLVDYAKSKHRVKRGGNNIRLSLSEAVLVAQDEKGVDLMALDEALDRLACRDEQQAKIVELKYFGGLSLDETAEMLKISRTTVARDWEAARAWLFRELTK